MAKDPVVEDLREGLGESPGVRSRAQGQADGQAQDAAAKAQHENGLLQDRRGEGRRRDRGGNNPHHNMHTIHQSLL